MKLDDIIQQPGQMERMQQETVLSRINVARPGLVMKYDEDEMTVDVQLAVRGLGEDELPPVLKGVPVVFVGSFTFNVQKGDECVVIFADGNVDAWWQTGNVANPLTGRKHDLSDGFALVGVHSKPNTTGWTKLEDVIGDVSNKADKGTGATSGDVAGLDATGNLTESGKKASDLADRVSGATSGNFAGLDSSGNLTDSGKKTSDFTYSAGSGLGLSNNTFRVDVPRVAESANHLPGNNSWVLREYTSGANYDLPSNAWYHIYEAKGSDAKYGTQLALGMTTDAAYYRRYSNDAWQPWKSLIDTNTWRPVQDNLTTQSSTDSLSANQGYLLRNGSARDSTKLPLAGGTMTGTIVLPINAVQLQFRNQTDYNTTVSYLTDGNEALVFASKKNVTSFMFVNGEDSITNHGSNRWRSLTPGLQIKQNCARVGGLWDSGTTPDYNLRVDGTSYLGRNVTVSAGTRINPSGGALYLGNSGNESWVYVQDMCSQSNNNWKIQQNGNATFNGTVTASSFSGNATSATKATQDGSGNTITSTYVTNTKVAYTTGTGHSASSSLTSASGSWYKQRCGDKYIVCATFSCQLGNVGGTIPAVSGYPASVADVTFTCVKAGSTIGVAKMTTGGIINIVSGSQQTKYEGTITYIASS